MPIPLAAIGLGLAGVKTGLGLFQAIKGANEAKKIKDPEAPQFTIPQERFENVQLAKNLASTGISGAEQRAFDINADRALASGIRSLTDRNAGGLGSILRSRQDGARGLAAQSAAIRRQNMPFLFRAQSDLANDRLREFQINEQLPFNLEIQQNQQRREAAQGLLGAGIQNVFSAADQVGATLINKENIDQLLELKRGGIPDGEVFKKAQLLGFDGTLPEFNDFLRAQEGFGIELNTTPFTPHPLSPTRSI